jgi:putative ubiquitin-RnfH superfamily antitoxin RatB of RatAB toxin-antitoxin module
MMPIEDEILAQIGDSHNEQDLVNAHMCFQAFKDKNTAEIEDIIAGSNLTTSISLESIQLLALVQLIRFSQSLAHSGDEVNILRNLIINFKKLYNGDPNKASFRTEMKTIIEQIFAETNRLLDSRAPMDDNRQILHRILYVALSLLHKKLPSTILSTEYIAMMALGLNASALRDQISAILKKLEDQSNTDEFVESAADSAEEYPRGRFSSSSSAAKSAISPGSAGASSSAQSNISPGRLSASAAQLFMKAPPPVPPTTLPYTWSLAELRTTAESYFSTAASAAAAAAATAASATGALLENAGLQAHAQVSSKEHTSPIASKVVAPADAKYPLPRAQAAPTIAEITGGRDHQILAVEQKLSDAARALGTRIKSTLANDDRIDPDHPSLPSSQGAPRSRVARRQTPPANVLTHDDLLNAVVRAQEQYRLWFAGQSGRAASMLLIERGIFHTQKGQQNVNRLVDHLRGVDSVGESKAAINAFLGERHGYKRHSFVAYLLDQLVQIDRVDSPWRGITANPDGTYARERVLDIIGGPHRGPAL